MKISEIRDMLANEGIYPSDISKRNDIFTFRRSFFYRPANQDAEYWKDRIQSVLNGAKIVDFGEIWKPFKGGAPVSKQSHFYVKFTI